MRPAKIQISLRIRAVSSESSLGVFLYSSKVSSCRQRRLWSDCADARADLSLRWAHMSEGTFPDVAAQFTMSHVFYFLPSTIWYISSSFVATKDLGPVVQSVVSLTSLLRVISLTVLVDSIYNILIFFAEKMWVAFALQKLLTFFQLKISAYLRITRLKF